MISLNKLKVKYLIYVNSLIWNCTQYQWQCENAWNYLFKDAITIIYVNKYEV